MTTGPRGLLSSGCSWYLKPLSGKVPVLTEYFKMSSQGLEVKHLPTMHNPEFNPQDCNSQQASKQAGMQMSSKQASYSQHSKVVMARLRVLIWTALRLRTFFVLLCWDNTQKGSHFGVFQISRLGKVYAKYFKIWKFLKSETLQNFRELITYV